MREASGKDLGLACPSGSFFGSGSQSSGLGNCTNVLSWDGFPVSYLICPLPVLAILAH